MFERKIIGYKGMSPEMRCLGLQYELGKTYEIKGELAICKNGFHFCKNLKDVENYYDPMESRIFKVVGFGKTTTIGNKTVCSKIKILEEVSKDELFKCFNKGNNNKGYYNKGDGNIGNCNKGDCNIGNYNKGDCNKGDGNKGDGNIGNYNQGYHNIGNKNQGYYNKGDGNIGNYNQGYYNTGNNNKLSVYGVQIPKGKFKKLQSILESYEYVGVSDIITICERLKLNKEQLKKIQKNSR